MYYLPKNTSEEQLRSLTGEDFNTYIINQRNRHGAFTVKIAYFWPLDFKWSEHWTHWSERPKQIFSIKENIQGSEQENIKNYETPKLQVDHEYEKNKLYNNPISKLHEYAQRHKLPTPVFKIVNFDVQKKMDLFIGIYTVECAILGKKYKGEALNKKEAKYWAANAALKDIELWLKSFAIKK